mmetsp:Transcript_67979/g.107806  ORF Transcript_67979/g.107806 Transcript_67979/m.107806 type:complete len:732 (+) Transcript_67979:46-2241(+)
MVLLTRGRTQDRQNREKRWQQINSGSRVVVLNGRHFPAFGAGDEGVVTRVDPEAQNCEVVFNGKAEAIPVALRHLRATSNSPRDITVTTDARREVETRREEIVEVTNSYAVVDNGAQVVYRSALPFSPEVESSVLRADTSTEWSPTRPEDTSASPVPSHRSGSLMHGGRSLSQTTLQPTPPLDPTTFNLPTSPTQLNENTAAANFSAGMAAIDAASAVRAAASVAALQNSGMLSSSKRIGTTYGCVSNAQANQLPRVVANGNGPWPPKGAIVERSHSESRAQVFESSPEKVTERQTGMTWLHVTQYKNEGLEAVANSGACTTSAVPIIQPWESGGYSASSTAPAPMPVVGLETSFDSQPNSSFVGLDRGREGAPTQTSKPAVGQSGAKLEVQVNNVWQALEECVRVMRMSSTDLQRFEGESFSGAHELQRIISSLRNAAEMGTTVLGYAGLANSTPNSTTIGMPRAVSSTGGVRRRGHSVATPVNVEVVGSQQGVSSARGVGAVQRARSGSPSCGTGQRRYLHATPSGNSASTQVFRDSNSLNLSTNNLNLSVSNLSMSSTAAPLPGSPGLSVSLTPTKPALRGSIAGPQMPSTMGPPMVGTWSSQGSAAAPVMRSSPPGTRNGSFNMQPPAWSSPPTTRNGSFNMQPPGRVSPPPMHGSAPGFPGGDSSLTQSMAFGGTFNAGALGGFQGGSTWPPALQSTWQGPSLPLQPAPALPGPPTNLGFDCSFQG